MKRTHSEKIYRQTFEKRAPYNPYCWDVSQDRLLIFYCFKFRLWMLIKSNHCANFVRGTVLAQSAERNPSPQHIENGLGRSSMCRSGKQEKRWASKQQSQLGSYTFFFSPSKLVPFSLSPPPLSSPDRHALLSDFSQPIQEMTKTSTVYCANTVARRKFAPDDLRSESTHEFKTIKILKIDHEGYPHKECVGPWILSETDFPNAMQPLKVISRLTLPIFNKKKSGQKSRNIPKVLFRKLSPNWTDERSLSRPL